MGVSNTQAISVGACRINTNLHHMRVRITEMQQQADQNIVDLVLKDRLTHAEFRQVPQEHDGSTSDLIVLLTVHG